ncbi:unnamed protein product [Cuscuta europaea]|uniref:Uncharacterized protein n=1 Tax=Cuscuta europaea TaxID=41803 RepID=A0A9P1EI00_CUSEU|nr:unnamed protein product [Cuscuta europaea]
MEGLEGQDAVIRYNFDKRKDLKTGMWYATCKWWEGKCSMGVSGGYGMAMKHIKSCDKAKGSGGFVDPIMAKNEPLKVMHADAVVEDSIDALSWPDVPDSEDQN